MTTNITNEIDNYVNELYAVFHLYKELNQYIGYLYSEDKIYQKIGAKHILEKEVQNQISYLPEKILKTFPINFNELKEKATKTLEELSKSTK